MQLRNRQLPPAAGTGEDGAGSRRGRHRGRVLICFAAALALTCPAKPGQEPPPGSSERPYLSPVANNLPDPNAQMQMREQQSKKQSFEAANLERKRQIAEDSAKLLKMAIDLKIEVDKTSKDELSLTVIRKADEIERLARSVKEKMKLTVGAN